MIRVAKSDADFKTAADNLAAAGHPVTLQEGQTLRDIFTRDEGCVVIDDEGGVITAWVQRASPGSIGPSTTESCIWVGHIQGKQASWHGLIVEMCRESLRRGTDKLPLYRTRDPESAIGEHYDTLDSDVAEVRPDSKEVVVTTVRRILDALGES